METSLPQKMFHVFWMVLSLSLILSVIPTAFAETGARHLSGIAKSFDTKKEMLTWLGPFEQCPLKIEDALYDPRKDRMAKLRKPGEVFHSNKDNQLLIKARLFDRIQRHFGIPEKTTPPMIQRLRKIPFLILIQSVGIFVMILILIHVPNSKVKNATVSFHSRHVSHAFMHHTVLPIRMRKFKPRIERRDHVPNACSDRDRDRESPLPEPLHAQRVGRTTARLW